MIGTKIKKLRELRNYSQEYMAIELGMSQSNFARIESNEVGVTDERLNHIAEVLGTDIDSIKNFDDTIIFNITQGNNSAAGLNCQVHNYQISAEIKKLYEDKILLLEEKVAYLTRLCEGKK
jgi:transcriptional regulator with XRE-family HTH domain